MFRRGSGLLSKFTSERVTPAMATGVVNRLMDIADLVAMLEEAGKKSVANNRR